MTDTSGSAAGTSWRQRWAVAWPWLGVFARLVVGAVWIVAGALKLPDPAESVRAVRAYRLLPEAVVPAIGYGLPVLEVVVGLMMIIGLATRPTAVISVVLLCGFIFGISAAWSRGLQIDCGCFGGGGQVAAADTRYPQEIARDVGLALLSLALVRWPGTRLALTNVLVATPTDDFDLDSSDPAPTREEIDK